MANAISDLFFVCIYLFLIFKFYLFLVGLGLPCSAQAFSSCGEQGQPFVAVLRLLVVLASLVAEHKLLGAWASVVAAHRL